MKKLLIENMKCFSEKSNVSLSNITINVGMNSVGKSTVTQAILLLRQTYDEMEKYRGTEKKDFRVLLNGRYGMQLGDAEQIISSGKDSIFIEGDGIGFQFKKNEEDRFSLNVYPDGNAMVLSNQQSLFSPYFYYLNAERQGPRNYQDIGYDSGKLCGYFGEQTFNVIELNAGAILDKKRMRHGEQFSVVTFSKQLEYWMDFIVPGIELRTSEDVDTKTAKLKVRQTGLDTEFNSPHNFGFGISYVMPIIVTGLLADTNSMVVVENPEAHLHPSGQSQIGQFLAQVASSGVQVIIETHSEHVINGIRIYALANKIPPEQICINYFTIDEKKPTVEHITLNDRFDIMKWPEGFFDQEEKDLQTLRSLRKGLS